MTVREDSDAVAALAKVKADLVNARIYLANGAGCYEMEDINYSVADHNLTLKNALKAFDKAIGEIAALESSPTKTLKQITDAVKFQMQIAAKHLTEAKKEGEEDGWDSERVEYAARQDGKVMAFKAVLAILTTSTDETDGKGGMR